MSPCTQKSLCFQLQEDTDQYNLQNNEGLLQLRSFSVIQSEEKSWEKANGTIYSAQKSQK